MIDTHTTQHSVTPAALLRAATTTTTQSITGGLWSHQSVITSDGLGCFSNTGEIPGSIAEAHVWAASTTLWPDLEVNRDNLDDLFHRCVNEDPGAGAVAYLAMLESNGGMLEKMLDHPDAHPDRILILDWVEVDPRWRGHAIGRRLAAQCLYVAGALSSETLVLSLPVRGDGPEGTLAEKRSCHLLRGLGLTRAPTGLWVGLCSPTRPGVLSEQHTST